MTDVQYPTPTPDIAWVRQQISELRGMVAEANRRAAQLSSWAAISGKPSVLTSDPNADRGLFWDDSAGALAFFSPTSPLSFSGTALQVAAASSTQVGVQENATDAEAIAGSSANLTVVPTALAAVLAVALPTGLTLPWDSTTAPTGFLLKNGSAVSRTTYANLFAFCNPVVGNPTVTIASPGVFTLSGHNMQTGQQVYLTTTGALPTGLSANTNYWVIRTSSTQFRLATSLANALAGTAINTSGSQSGTHTIRTTFGVGNGSTTFNLPDWTGKTPVGVDTAQAEFAALGMTGGAKTHTLTVAEMPSHTHTVNDGNSPTLLSQGGSTYGVQYSPIQSGATGGGGAHNNLQPYVVTNWIIKT